MTGARQAESRGPLAGILVVEMAGLGPAPLAALMLAEMGASVLRIERKNEKQFLKLSENNDFNRHGRAIVSVDLKAPEGVALVLDAVARADMLIEGFRPGVMERLGLGPDAALLRNPRLIYGRVTGFGQTGPLAERAGHDLTYLAYSGILHGIGHADSRPVPPLNLIGDYGGGTMPLLTGLLAALIERGRSGRGQVVDAAMVDGALTLALPLFAYMAEGAWLDARGVNLLDSGCPFYDTYTAADGLHVAVACLEPQFFAEFARLLPLDQRFVAAQYDRAIWDDMRAVIAARLKERSRDAWSAHFEGSDACVAPVLSFAEAEKHPHNRARSAHVAVGGGMRPAPAPRLSRTPSHPAGPHKPAEAAAVLAAFGIDQADRLVPEGAAS